MQVATGDMYYSGYARIDLNRVVPISLGDLEDRDNLASSVLMSVGLLNLVVPA
eukprot:SAG11_NODE_22529_length_404_cov_1.160656_1_plen_53_part_00